MGPLQLQLMDQEERLARVGVLCTGPTRLLRPAKERMPLRRNAGFEPPHPTTTGPLRPLGSPHEAWTAAANDVPLLVPYRPLARLAFAWFC